MKHYFKMVALGALISLVPSLSRAMNIENGETISVLDGARLEFWEWEPSGFCRLVTDELAKCGIKKNPFGVGLDRVKTAEMLARLDSVIEASPAYAILMPMCADYNPWTEPHPSESYTKNLGEIMTKLKAANIKTIIVTSYAQNSNSEFSPNNNTADYNEVIRGLAQEHGATLIDLTEILDKAEKPVPLDGSPAAKALVNQIFAGEVLRVLGFSDQEVADCRKAWLDTPGLVMLPPKP